MSKLELQSFTFYLIFKPFSCGFLVVCKKLLEDQPSSPLKKTTKQTRLKSTSVILKIAFLTRKLSLSKNRQLEVLEK